MAIELSPTIQDEIKHKSLMHYNDNSIRIGRIQDYYDIYKLLWDFDPPEGDWVQKLPSPEPHNAIKGIVRLMIGSEPTIKVRADGSDAIFPERATKVSRAILRENDRRGPWIVSYDLSMSAALAGEAYVRCANVEDNVKFLETKGRDALARRYRRLAREKPFIYRVFPPDTVYPIYSDLGLEGIILRYERPQYEIPYFWGEDALEGYQTPAESMQATEQEVPTVIYWEYHGHDYRMVWLDGSPEPIVAEDNKLGFIPWAGSIVEGSSLFDLPEDQRLPILYPVLQSGYWHAQSYADSIMYSLALNLGKLPQLKVNLNDPDRNVDDLIDWGTALGVLRLQINEKAEMMDKRVIDESLQIASQISGRRMDSMLVPKQVLGASPEGQMAFASMNLLVQAGRLPLVPIQRMVGVIMGHMLEIPWLWAKAKKKKYTIPSFDDEQLVIDPQEFDNIFIQAKLHAQFAQDDAQRVAIAGNATAQQLWSRERAMEYTGVEEPLTEMAKIDDDIERVQKQQAILAGETQNLMQMSQAGQLRPLPIGGQNLNPQQVSYRPGENPIMICGNCQHFRGPGIPCGVVNFAIDPFYTCAQWYPNPEVAGASTPQDMMQMAGGGQQPQLPPPPNGGGGLGGEQAPAMFDPNTQQGGGGLPQAMTNPAGTTREGVTGQDRGGNPIVQGQGLPLG